MFELSAKVKGVGKTKLFTDPQEDALFQKYLEPFDGVIMWNWKECNYRQIPEKFEIFKKMTPGQRRMFGCYQWNFGEEKAATAEAVTWQLNWYRERILAGEAEGVVLHTNTMADLDLPPTMPPWNGWQNMLRKISDSSTAWIPFQIGIYRADAQIQNS